MNQTSTLRGFSFLASTILALLLIGCGSGNDSGTSSQGISSPLVNATADLPRPNATLDATPSTSNNANVTSTPSSNTPSGVNTTIISTDQSSVQTSQSVLSMRRFLWKPISEGDGNVVVLVDPPNIRVEVFGAISETLRDFGPSNDRGTTARGSFPGCSYGGNVQVQFFSGGRQIGFVDGTSTVNVGNGCDRVEFNL